MAPNPAPHAGYTIAEMMVVTAIIGILAAAGFSLFRSVMLSQRMKSASFDFYSALSVARSEALKRGTSVAITPGADANWAASGWTISYVGDHDNEPTTPDQTIEIGRHGPASGISIAPSPGPLPSLVFNRNGRPSSIAAFQVEATAEHRTCIRLELSGSPRTLKGSCA
jgi:type IV fimbrial biogenesis protein FimT